MYLLWNSLAILLRKCKKRGTHTWSEEGRFTKSGRCREMCGLQSTITRRLGCSLFWYLPWILFRNGVHCACVCICVMISWKWSHLCKPHALYEWPHIRNRITQIPKCWWAGKANHFTEHRKKSEQIKPNKKKMIHSKRANSDRIEMNYKFQQWQRVLCGLFSRGMLAFHMFFFLNGMCASQTPLNTNRLFAWMWISTVKPAPAWLTSNRRIFL